MSPPVLSVQNLAKVFGSVKAVDGVSFHVSPGEIVGLLGPNGAGKTTTINMMLGVLEPTAGRIAIQGVDLRHRSQRGARRHKFRRRLRAAARQSHGRAEPARVRHDLRCREPDPADRGAARDLRPRKIPQDKGGRSVLGRADAARPRQGDAQPSAPAAARRADRLDRPIRGARHPRRHRRLRRERPLRGLVDEPQHVRGRGGLRPGAVSLARENRARRRPEDAAGRAWLGDARRSLRHRRARSARGQGGAA